MKVLTFLNEKGGVGKTTLATTLAAGLAIIGKNVLVIDADPQGHAGLILGIEKAPGFYDLVVRKRPFTEIVYEVPRDRYVVPDNVQDVTGNLFVIPGNMETRGIPLQVKDDTFAVLSAITQLSNAGVIDYVIFDTAPTPSLTHAMIYMATDSIIYPIEPTALSLDGLSESLRHADKTNRIRASEGLPPVRVHGIVPMRVKRTLEHSDNIKEVIRAFGRESLYPPMPERTVWQETTRARKAIFAYAPFEDAAEHAKKFVNRFLQGEGLTERV